jgi:hypothetical protein
MAFSRTRGNLAAAIRVPRTMKLFECQNCGHPLYIENTKCESCGLRLRYLPKLEVVTALEEVDGVWSALAAQGAR